MTRVDKVTLIAETREKDDIGQEVSTETGRGVICTASAVTRAEWSAASQRMFSPAAVLRVFFRDYRGEKLAEYRGRRYDIYRTFQSGDYIELYLGTKVGELHG